LSDHSNVRYAYVVTLIGVVLAGVSMVYSAVRSLMFSRGFRSHGFMSGGNFTGSQFGNFTARQFGNFTGTFNGPPRFAYNPYGGLSNYVTIIAAIIAIVGIVWLGIALNSQKRL